MKKFLALILAAFLFVGIVACDDNKKDDGGDTDTYTEVTGIALDDLKDDLVAVFAAMGTDSLWQSYKYTNSLSKTGTENGTVVSRLMNAAGFVKKGGNPSALNESTDNVNGVITTRGTYLLNGNYYNKTQVGSAAAEKTKRTATATDINYFGDSTLRGLIATTTLPSSMQIYQTAASGDRTLRLVSSATTTVEGNTTTSAQTIEIKMNSANKITKFHITDTTAVTGTNNWQSAGTIAYEPFSGTITFPTDLDTYVDSSTGGGNEYTSAQMAQLLTDGINQILTANQWKKYTYLYDNYMAYNLSDYGGQYEEYLSALGEVDKTGASIKVSYDEISYNSETDEEVQYFEYILNNWKYSKTEGETGSKVTATSEDITWHTDYCGYEDFSYFLSVMSEAAFGYEITSEGTLLVAMQYQYIEETDYDFYTGEYYEQVYFHIEFDSEGNAISMYFEDIWGEEYSDGEWYEFGAFYEMAILDGNIVFPDFSEYTA